MIAIAACGASGAAFADNPLGFYVGAGAGESQIRSDDSYYGLSRLLQRLPIRLAGDRRHPAHPPMSGLEADYIDFGQPLSAPRLLRLQLLRHAIPIPRRRRCSGGLSAAAHAVPRCVRQGGRRAALRPISPISCNSPVRPVRPCPYLVPADRRQVIRLREVRLRRGRAVEISVDCIPRRIRAHQLAIRRSGRADGQRDLDVLSRRHACGARECGRSRRRGAAYTRAHDSILRLARIPGLVCAAGDCRRACAKLCRVATAPQRHRRPS